MEWEEKPWGKRRTLHIDSDVQIDEILVNAGGKSSIHRHLDKDNSFILVSGEFAVIVAADTPFPQSIDLVNEGPDSGSLLIPPEVWHQFVAKTAVRAIEVYRRQVGGPPVRFEDIERKPAK
jgi:mannose-6-phosphate isomerase-like protein (cupin superfamily)